jgi:hypothetical protein
MLIGPGTNDSELTSVNERYDYAIYDRLSNILARV